MKKFSLLSLATLVFALTAQIAVAAVGTPATPLPLLTEQRLNNSALSAPIVKLGTQITQKKVQVLKAVYDFAVLGGASGSSIVLKDGSGGDATLPKGAIIKSVAFSNPTALTGNTGSPTLSFGIESASTDMKAATAIASFATANGMLTGIQVPGTLSTWTRVAGFNHTVNVKIASGNVTAGKVVAYIEYYVGAPNE
jgi:hypothetical protein